VGINPFAAQIIIASLKEPLDLQGLATTSTSAPQVVSASGLSAFLMMSEEKRVRFFQALMGGSRILRRVSKVLDGEWVSAAHGFKM
jgi:hypothetical protein